MADFLRRLWSKVRIIGDKAVASGFLQRQFDDRMSSTLDVKGTAVVDQRS